MIVEVRDDGVSEAMAEQLAYWFPNGWILAIKSFYIEQALFDQPHVEVVVMSK